MFPTAITINPTTSSKFPVSSFSPCDLLSATHLQQILFSVLHHEFRMPSWALVAPASFFVEVDFPWHLSPSTNVAASSSLHRQSLRSLVLGANRAISAAATLPALFSSIKLIVFDLPSLSHLQFKRFVFTELESPDLTLTHDSNFIQQPSINKHGHNFKFFFTPACISIPPTNGAHMHPPLTSEQSALLTFLHFQVVQAFFILLAQNKCTNRCTADSFLLVMTPKQHSTSKFRMGYVFQQPTNLNSEH
eukprot:Gb_02612 [translate_table: standard]